MKTNMLARAISIASKAFENTFDKGGKPYILHCLRVMFSVKQEEERMIIAILHDVNEDFPDLYPISFFVKEGFSDRVISALILLSHDKDKVSYDDYIKAIALNEDAKDVKKRDLEDNSNITRLKGIRKKDLDRIEKYHKSYLYLTD